jgi:mycoredoxin
VSAAPDCLLYYDPARQGELRDQVGSSCEAIGVTPEGPGGEVRRQLGELGLSVADDLPVLLLLAGDAWGGGNAGAGGAGAMAGSGGIGKRRLRLLGVRLSPSEAARLAAGGGFAASEVVVYGSAGCTDCRRAKRVLEEARVSYAEVDLDQDPVAEALVVRRSGGQRVVPTLQLDGRVWAFNPGPALLRRLVAPAGESAVRSACEQS